MIGKRRFVWILKPAVVHWIRLLFCRGATAEWSDLARHQQMCRSQLRTQPLELQLSNEPFQAEVGHWVCILRALGFEMGAGKSVGEGSLRICFTTIARSGSQNWKLC